MKQLLLIVALLLAGSDRWAVAQSTPPTTPATIATPTVAVVDSAALLHQLFKRERRIGLLGLVATTGLSNGINTLNGLGEVRQFIGWTAVGANTGLLVIMVVNRIKFNRHREQEAIDQLRQHQLLRPYVRRSYTLALVKASRPRR